MNTKSSTESEVVGTDNVMPQVLWTLYFLEAQGYKMNNNVLYQDKKSSILLETNGHGSSRKWTRHINVCYFLLPIGSSPKKPALNIAQLESWSLTLLPNHCKEWYSGNYGT
jgi:hypothetical protein